MSRSPAPSRAATPRRARRLPGFTLLEVMFAILILGVGLVAVAGIFPIAGGIQRDTYDQAIAQSVATSAEQYLIGRGLRSTDLSGIAANVTYSTTLTSLIPLSERCAPFYYDSNGNGTPNENGEDPTFVSRDYYWYPLFRNDPNFGYQAYIFVMKRPQNLTLNADGTPLTPTTTGGIAAGDLYVRLDGTVDTARTDDDGNAAGAWRAPVLNGNSVVSAKTGTSTFKQLSVVGSEVVR